MLIKFAVCIYNCVLFSIQICTDVYYSILLSTHRKIILLRTLVFGFKVISVNAKENPSDEYNKIDADVFSHGITHIFLDCRAFGGWREPEISLK